MAIRKIGSPEKIQMTEVSSDRFEENWEGLKKTAALARCEGCRDLLATGKGKMVTLKKGDLSAIVHGASSIDIKCPRCGVINSLHT